MLNWNRARLLLSLLAALAVTAAPSAIAEEASLPTERPVPSLFSVQTHSLYGDAQTHQRAVDWAKEMGAGQIRDELFWHLVEKKKGVYRIPPNCLENIQTTRNAGVDVILLLNYSNALYDDGLAPTSQEALAAFAGYCAHMAKELKGQVETFEIWNEPNVDGFWRPKKDPKAYTALLKKAYLAIKAANPEATVLGCSLAGLDHEFFDVVAAEGGLASMDAISVHTYIPPGSPEERAIFNEVRAFSKKVNALADRSLPVWITEMGWPTQKGGGVSELRQAEMVARTYLMACAYPEIKTLCWYWLGPDGPDDEWAEDRFSLTHPDGSPKPGRIAYGTVSRQLDGARFDRWLIDSQGVKLMVLEHPKGARIALWAADDRLHRIDLENVTRVTTLGGESTPLPYESIRVEFDGEPLVFDLRGSIPDSCIQSVTGVQRACPALVSPGGQILSRPASDQMEYRLTPRWNEKFVESASKETGVAFLIDKRMPYGPGRADLLTIDRRNARVEIQAYAFLVREPLIVLFDPEFDEQDRPFVCMQLLSASGPLQGDLTARIRVNGRASDLFPNIIPMNGVEKQVRLPVTGTVPADQVIDVHVELKLPDDTIVQKNDVLSFWRIHRAKSPVTIDGILSEWNIDPKDTLHLGRRDQYQLAGMNWDGPQDASARVAMTWDSQWLYLAAKVLDDVFSDPETGFGVYNNDGFELYFDTDPGGDPLDTAYSGDDHQWGVCASQGRAVVYRYSQQTDESPKGRAVIRPTTDGYTLEAKIPATELVPKTGGGKFPGRFEAGMHFGFTIALNDDDTPDSTHPFFQDLQLQWSRRRNAFMNPAAFADLFFVE